MANPATELPEELKEFALTLPTSTFPKNFFCALCGQLAFDSWKLPCCNKSICLSCHSKPDFPTTCPLCDHSPLEAESCITNKSLRSTMRVWLQKQKKKEEAKNASQPATPVVPTSIGLDAQQPAETPDKPVESVEPASKAEGATDRQNAMAGDDDGEAVPRAGSAVNQSKENSTAPQTDEAQRRASLDSQSANKSLEPTSGPDDTNATQNSMDGSADGMYGNNGMFMNGMPNQFGYGMNPNQGGFNNGMGWNGMNPINGMPNMMGDGNWNNMNPMDFNNMNMPNGMYSGFGGNMGMPGMNDMSMMNYGGGYGNGWNGGMNGGYGNFNGYPMGGYNQSGAQFPQMMNQFPKNNFQNQNRFHPNGAAFSQQNNRRGSYGNFGNQNNGPGFQQNAHSRPGSRSGPSQNVRRFHKESSVPPAHLPHSLPQPPKTNASAPLQRDGESPAGDAEAVATETNIKVEHAKASAEPAQEGKDETEGTSESVATSAEQAGDATKNPNELTGTADNANNVQQLSGLNHIQTVDSMEANTSNFDPSMMNNTMQSNQQYAQGMMGNFPSQGSNMNGPYGGGMGFNQHNYGHSGGFNAAYGAATVLTGEPRGVGVEGAPTGPRAMREGRPNTGFSSRSYNAKFNQQHQPTPSAPSAQEAPPASPPRKGRSSPERDDSLRTKDKSPSRSPSPSKVRAQDDAKDNYKERSRSTEREPEHNHRDRSVTPSYDDGYDRRKEDRHHRSSRYDDHDDRGYEREDYEDRHRDDRDDRGDRTRSTSVESKHRSRRDKDRHRSSRSHRDRSREHRRRHRSRSRSPIADERYEEDESYTNGDRESESSSRRKDRSDKDKHRERNRDRSRDRDRDRDRRDRQDRDYDREYEYEKEKDRSRDKDRDRKRSRRDRDRDEDEREYEDEEYRSSRRSRKDRERDRDRERDADRDYETKEKDELPPRTASPPLNAPLGPSADGFSIRGFSKAKRAEGPTSVSKPMPPPPTGPRALQPPKGPAADRDRERRDSRDHRRKSSISSIPTTPTTPTAPTSDQNHNHYAADREKHIKERVDKDNRDRLISSIHGRATGRSNSISSTRPSLSSKRSRDDFEDSNPTQDDGGRDRDIKIPTGPAAHRDKRRKSGDNAIANMFTAGLRKQAGKRRGGVKNEGDAERELERVERERDKRW